MRNVSKQLTIGGLTLAALSLLTGCPRTEVDRCAGDDIHPECPGAQHDLGDGDDSNDAAHDAQSPDAHVDAGPCGGRCSGATPHCDAAAGECVQCLEAAHCAAGVCTPDFRCVECIETADCAAGVCDPASNACVGCLTNADCPDPAAARCDTTTQLCTTCTAAADCAHLTDTRLCDVDTCVQCRDDDDTTRAACNGNSCDPATSTCTQTAVGSLAACDYCLADSECPTGFRCVPMEFQGTPRNNGVGGYCMREFNMMPCPLPYQTLINRASLSGAPAEDYCGIVEANTTCEAVLDVVGNAACATAEDCGAADLDDARCESIVAELKCTYDCGASSQCPSGLTCGPTDGFCGGN